MVNKSSPPMDKRLRGFTLIELLVSLGIVALLSAFVLAGVNRARSAADRAATAQSLRSIGTAMQSYASDHNFELPGPLYNAQSAWYSSKNPGALGTFLWSYLGCPEPLPTSRECKVINNPANERIRAATDTPVYLMRPEVTLKGAPTTPPFGIRDSKGITTQRPMRLQALAGYGLSTNWAMVDIDQQIKRVQGWGTSSYPKSPVLGNVRMALYFDWHVSAVPIEEGP